jgi:hypothetical protein
MTNIRNHAIAFGLAGALAIGLSATASAGPLPIGNAGMKNAATDQVTEVRWRGGRGFGPAIGIGAGIAAGALIGSAVAGSAYGPGYYYDQPVYGAPVYAQPYGYEQGYPAQQYYVPQQYYAPRYGYGGAVCEEGYRRVPCSGY